jgi:hypothetical protein
MNMAKLMLYSALMVFSAIIGKNQLIGRWESKPSEKGNVTGVVFKDSTFEGYVNKKPFVSGIYKFENEIFSFIDNGCEGKRGVYKIIFFSNSDSLRFEPVNDSCSDRRNGMRRLVLGRKN